MAVRFNPFTGTLDFVGTGGGGGGDVTGPASSTDNAVARFDGTTGKIIQNSVVTISDTGELAGVTTINGINVSPSAATIAFYVDSANGSDTTGNGSHLAPFETIEKALTLCTNPALDYAILPHPGDYGSGEAIAWPANVSLIGVDASTTNINKVITYTAAALDEADFTFSAVTCNDLNFDLTLASIAIITLKDGGYAVTRTDSNGSGPWYLNIQNSAIGDSDLDGVNIISSCNFISTLNIPDGGQLVLLTDIFGISATLTGTASIVSLGTVLTGSLTGTPVGPNTPKLYTDSGISLFPPTLTDVDVVYINKAEFTEYTPDDPSDWDTPPSVVSDALDYLAARSALIEGYNVDKFTLNGTDISNKFVTLAETPAIAADTRVIVIGGVEQEYSVDFTVSGSTIDWDGLGLDGLLASGDKLVVVYNE